AEGSRFENGLDFRSLEAFKFVRRAAEQEKENRIKKFDAALPADHYLRAYGYIGLGNAKPCNLPREYHEWLSNQSREEEKAYSRISYKFREAYLLFIVGHEIGHHVKGHFEGSQLDALRMESEADSYAASTIFRVLGPERVIESYAPVALLHYFYG